MFNILTRTNSRPNYFFLCHESIKKQVFADESIKINHFISVDDNNTMNYLKYYDNIKTVEVEKIPKKHGNEFPYNLYLNAMVSHIEDGWIMVLDDDDKFYKNDSLKILKKHINENNEDTMFIWRVRVGARLIPSDLNFEKRQIKRADICNIGFMIHSKHKDKLVWKNIRAGDFKVIEELSKTLNTVWLDEIITSTNNNAGNFGNQRDTRFNTEEKEKYEKFITHNEDSGIKSIMHEINNEDKKVILDNIVSQFLNDDVVVSPDLMDQEREITFHKNIVDEDEQCYEEEEKEDFTISKYQLNSESDESNEIDENKECVQDYDQRDTKNIGPLYELLKSNEKIYIMKESSIVMIAEMLSSAIESKKLYEDIVNKSYLKQTDGSSLTGVGVGGVGGVGVTEAAIIPKNNVEKKTNQNDARELLEELEREEEIKNNIYDIDNIVCDLSSNIQENAIDAVYILHKNKNKEDLEDYFESCGISKNIQNYIKTYDINFKTLDVINICKKVVDKNQKRIIILHENTLVINNFNKELNIMCNDDNFKNCGLIVCGNKSSFGSLNTKTKVLKRVKNTKVKFKQEIIINVNFDEKYYTSVYDDIKHLNLNTYEKAYQHWKTYGFDEQRYGSRSLLPIKSSKYPFDTFNGIILTQHICKCISECFDPTLIGIILEKEYNQDLYEYSPYLFESDETLKLRKVNDCLYKKQ